MDYGPPGAVGRLAWLTGGGRLIAIRARAGRGSTAASSPTCSTSSAATTCGSRGDGTIGHEPFGEHPLGLAVDILPGAGGAWDDVSRLARWAEPRQNHPRAPFRWVGWNGDFNHGHPSVCKPRLRLRPAPAPLLVPLAHAAASHRADGARVRRLTRRGLTPTRSGFPARAAPPGRTAADLAERLLAGDKRALARAISLVEDDDPEGWALVARCIRRPGRAAVVGFTGPPGVGKSTLIGRLVEHVRARDREVAVLSIDPSSPFTHGALLGDRIRLTDHFLDPGVFIRSMASRGSLGGLSEATLQAALLMDASGKDDVFLETVGVGQAEVDIIDHADTVVLVLMPGSGDSIQALKAGVMEIPDVIAVNKADHPLTDTMVREIRGVLSLGRRRAGACRSSGPRRAGARVSRSWREDRRAPRVHRVPRERSPSGAGGT